MGRLRVVLGIILILWTIGITGFSDVSSGYAASQSEGTYNIFKQIGIYAAMESLQNMYAKGVVPDLENLIVMSNAGYAEIVGMSTQGALDGLILATGVSRGKLSMIEIHSVYNAPLWFAIYDKVSGLCSYLQVNPAPTGMEDLFSINAIEQINADHLFANANEYSAKFNSGVFGGNEFRIVTIMNGITAGAPEYAVRAFEFHDHYCPGVSSGLMMINYLKKYFPIMTGGSYFVQAIQPWCKEDAMMVLLNATPGKTGFAAVYANADDMATWKPDVKAKNAANIIYRYNPQTKKWDGVVLGFIFADTGCPNYDSNGTITKLCMDLWYLPRLDQPESYVTEILHFDLPSGVVPKDLARPGVDAMKLLGLTQS